MEPGEIHEGVAFVFGVAKTLGLRVGIVGDLEVIAAETGD
jgi:hypothetical protein